MSQLQSAAKCNGCKEQTLDLIRAGWIEFYGKIVKNDGRDQKGHGKKPVMWGHANSESPVHFCSIECLIFWAEEGAKRGQD